MPRVGVIEPEFNGEGSNLSFALSSGLERVPEPGDRLAGKIPSELLVFKWLDKKGNVIGYFVYQFIHLPDGTLAAHYDAIDDRTFTLSGVSAPAGSVPPFSPTDSTQNYNYLTSLLNGDVNVVIRRGRCRRGSRQRRHRVCRHRRRDHAVRLASQERDLEQCGAR